MLFLLIDKSGERIVDTLFSGKQLARIHCVARLSRVEIVVLCHFFYGSLKKKFIDFTVD